MLLYKLYEFSLFNVWMLEAESIDVQLKYVVATTKLCDLIDGLRISQVCY